MESAKWLVGFKSLLMISESSLLCSQPLPTPHAEHLSILDVVRKKRASLATSCIVGDAGRSLTCSYFPLWENCSFGGCFLDVTCAAYGGSDSGNVKLFLVLSSVHLILFFLFFFHFYDMLKLCWTPDSHKMLFLLVDDYQNWGSLQGEVMADITSDVV